MNNGIFINLNNQFQSLYKHNRQGSIKTRHRYREAMARFLVFLAVEYRLEKLANVGPKHVCRYVEYLQEKGVSIAYLKTELAAVRFWMDQVPRRQAQAAQQQGAWAGQAAVRRRGLHLV